MFVVCDETAEQKARDRAEKEGKVKQLLEQYKRIQGMAIGLRHVNEDIPGLVSDEAVEVMINKINLKMHALAHEIVRELKQELDNAAKDLNEPEQLGKPLWALVPEDVDDDGWRRNKGAFKQLRSYMFTNRQDAEDHKTDGYKVIPVWGE
jgi:hypothetical protein